MCLCIYTDYAGTPACGSVGCNCNQGHRRHNSLWWVLSRARARTRTHAHTHARSFFLLLAFFLPSFRRFLSLSSFSVNGLLTVTTLLNLLFFFFSVTLSSAILFIIVFVTFAYTGTWAFGKERSEFANLQAGMTTQFFMLNGGEFDRLDTSRGRDCSWQCIVLVHTNNLISNRFPWRVWRGQQADCICSLDLCRPVPVDVELHAR